MKSKALFSVMVFIAIVGCAKIIVTPLESYKQLKYRNCAKSDDQIDFANAKEIKQTTANDFKLIPADSVLQYDDTLYSNYQVFKFRTNARRLHRINIISYGRGNNALKVFVLMPKIKVFDKTLRQVELKVDSSVATFNDPMIRRAWVFEQNHQDDYYLIVFADNSKVGKVMMKTDPFAYYGAGLLGSIKGKVIYSLSGDYRIRVEDL